MALPTRDISWPPESLNQVLPAMDQWSAWFANSPERLEAAYGGAVDDSTGFFMSQTGGMKPGAVSRAVRWFVGRASTEARGSTKLPIPLTGELCQASADLLFSEQVFLTVKNEATRERLNVLAGDGMHSTLAEAAELCAALGGVYVRVTWDEAVADAPFLTAVDADMVVPEFKWGRLVGATIWQVVHRDGKKVWRHLERHELDSLGVGVILHGLYLGSEDKLGSKVALNTLPATQALAELVDEQGMISTQSPGLAIEYVPNQTPNRLWRHDPVGRNLGRPDIDGVEHLLDAYAETMSSWMRDIRLGKARVMIAKNLTQSLGPGKGSAFDAEQEFYTQVAKVQSKDDSLANQIQLVQFKIRVAEHAQTARMLVEQIIQAAGYSLQTFGVPDPTAANSDTTATEVEAKQQRSMLTRDRKVRVWRPRLARIVRKLLEVDKAIFGTQITPETPIVGFQDGVQESQKVLAETAQLLYAAESASTKVRVALVHPDWTDTQVGEEASRILKESGGGAAAGLIGDTESTSAAA